MLTTIEFETPAGDALLNITDLVQSAIQHMGIPSGLCALIVPHTTAAITINSSLDPTTPDDIVNDVRRLVPTRVDFKHQYDTPADAAGHIKSTLIGQSVLLVVDNGSLLLGGSQSILFYEFDGPRTRRVQIKVIPG
ncbi:MAG TPA: secondary thiamine-phosphate synthase enzyme YjbQ [Aggregatilineaceae bacterium]|nr:secondary thiamine-phosphate synthase enzyme YjbQ [Aggregatilineaceae bacterium]